MSHCKALIVGQSNVGKTTIYNALTGQDEAVGNWSGVTVESSEKTFQFGHELWTLCDTPGVRALMPQFLDQLPRDAQITHRQIFDQSPDLIINVVDALTLQRDLFLTSQLMELDIPMVVLVNRGSMKASKKIDWDALSADMGVPVLCYSGQQRNEFFSEIQQILQKKYSPNLIDAWCALPQKECEPDQSNVTLSLALRWIARDPYVSATNAQRAFIEKRMEGVIDRDVFLTELRLKHVLKWMKMPPIENKVVRYKLDRWLLHPIIGVVIFIAVMMLMFYVTVSLGVGLQDVMVRFLNVLLINGVGSVLHAFVPEWLLNVFLQGAMTGLIISLSFFPLMMVLNFFQYTIEETGYWPRTVFLMDQWMSRFGLHGQSFIPMMLGFGCNVPAIFATRTMMYEKDRIVTAMMIPFMSCSARLTLYVLFSVMFFGNKAYWVIAFLYLLGIGIALISGYVLNRWVLETPKSPLFQTLPPLRWPSLRLCVRTGYRRSVRFIIRASKVVVPVCLGVAVLASIPLSGGSVLWGLGKALAWVFKPLGFDASSWPICVALLVGILAKEVIISVLQTLSWGGRCLAKL